MKDADMKYGPTKKATNCDCPECAHSRKMRLEAMAKDVLDGSTEPQSEPMTVQYKPVLGDGKYRLLLRSDGLWSLERTEKGAAPLTRETSLEVLSLSSTLYLIVT